MQLKKIKVYGKLRQFLGKSYFKAAVRSPEQAMRFLFANYNGLEKHMNDQIYKIKMGGEVVDEELLSMSGQGDIQIIPIATGSLTLVAGIGIIGGAAFAGTVVGAGILGTTLVASLNILGTTLIVDGISNLLRDQTPMSTTIDDIDPRIRGSYSFSGISNVSSSGVPIPIIYGLVYSGSILISAGVDTAQIKAFITAGGAASEPDVTLTEVVGTTTANSTVELFDGSNSLGTTTTDSTGSFSISTDEVSAGTSLTVTTTDSGGNVSSSTTTGTSSTIAGGPRYVVSADGTGTGEAGRLMTVFLTNHQYLPRDFIHINYLTGPRAGSASHAFIIDTVTTNSFTGKLDKGVSVTIGGINKCEILEFFRPPS